MPFPNEHAARMKSPSQCDRIRRKNNKLGTGVHVLWCINPGKPTTIQSIHFSAARFTADEARTWLKEHKYSGYTFEPATGKGD